MKILMVNKYFFLKGGAETVFFQERDFLISQGHQVIDFSMYDPRNAKSAYADYFVGSKDYHDKSPGLIEKITTGLSLIHSREAIRKMETLLDAEKPDLIHCHNIYHQLTPGILLAAHKRSIPIVLTLHDYKVVCPVYTRLHDGQVCTECSQGAFRNLLLHRCSEGSLGRSALLYAEATVQKLLGSYEVVDKVIVPSGFMGEAVTQWRFPKERVQLLYNGVDPAHYPISGSDKGYVLFLGRLSGEKGLLTLGRAQAGTQIPVVVAGTGPVESQLREEFPGLKLAGYQTGDALKALIADAAAIVVPSEWHENCPMSVLEAMAAGKPVIGSRMGGIPELVADGQTGLLFTAGDIEGLRQCMSSLLADEPLRHRMGLAARARVESDFSLDKHFAGLQAVYDEVLAGQKAKPSA